VAAETSLLRRGLLLQLAEIDPGALTGGHLLEMSPPKVHAHRIEPAEDVKPPSKGDKVSNFH
jgi:hypothetical protein